LDLKHLLGDSGIDPTYANFTQEIIYRKWKKKKDHVFNKIERHSYWKLKTADQDDSMIIF
jgi:hypothetical protein